VRHKRVSSGEATSVDDPIVFINVGNPVGVGLVDSLSRPGGNVTGFSDMHAVAVLRGHEGRVNTAAFSPDGPRVVTASGDRTARIWDAASGKEIAVLRGHDKEVVSAAFSPEGLRIITGSDDHTARIWDARLEMMPVKRLLEEACARLAGVTKLAREESASPATRTACLRSTCVKNKRCSHTMDA
jgi:WD40 repeat protein